VALPLQNRRNGYIRGGYPECIKQAADLPKEYRVASAPGQSSSPLLDVINADRACPEWYENEPGLSPQEHLARMLDMRYEQDRRAHEAKLAELERQVHAENAKHSAAIAESAETAKGLQGEIRDLQREIRDIQVEGGRVQKGDSKLNRFGAFPIAIVAAVFVILAYTRPPSAGPVNVTVTMPSPQPSAATPVPIGPPPSPTVAFTAPPSRPPTTAPTVPSGPDLR